MERVLREGAYDAAIELRGDFRHILAMANTGIKYRVGLARTGLGFLLTHRLEYQPGQHEIERNLESLRQMGIEISRKAKFPQLYPRKIDDLNQKKVRKKLGITHPVLAVHATCFALAKRWPIASWAQLLDKLPKKIDVVLIGAESEKTDMETIQKACRRKIFLTAGLLSLPELTAFLKKSKLFIGVDSGPAHIAAAVGIPVLSLYSGTNQKEQWGPMGSKVTVIQKKPACSPCERLVCPIGNECMNLIRVDEVLKQVERILNN